MASVSAHKLAVLIDADNARPAIVEGLLAEIAKYGTAQVKRIYGDWTKPDLNGWKEVLLRHSIQPIQQFRYTVGKNATDSAMIIDAMDLRAFGIGPRPWLEHLRYHTRDLLLIAFGVVMLVAGFVLVFRGYGVLWVPPAWLHLAGG